MHQFMLLTELLLELEKPPLNIMFIEAVKPDTCKRQTTSLRPYSMESVKTNSVLADTAYLKFSGTAFRQDLSSKEIILIILWELEIMCIILP
jgi:hypothetical protein